jgi:hypothetical protein
MGVSKKIAICLNIYFPMNSGNICRKTQVFSLVKRIISPKSFKKKFESCNLGPALHPSAEGFFYCPAVFLLKLRFLTFKIAGQAKIANAATAVFLITIRFTANSHQVTRLSVTIAL